QISSMANPTASASCAELKAIVSESRDLVWSDPTAGVDSSTWARSTSLLHRLSTQVELMSLRESVEPAAPQAISARQREAGDAQQRARTLLIYGVEEPSFFLPPKERFDIDHAAVCRLLALLGVDVAPRFIYRIGSAVGAGARPAPRILNVLLPNRAHMLTALKNARGLRR
ncbi:hypothetical protein PFISCL1PPCAC_13150, partial [Pristionchus fissidentatus]